MILESENEIKVIKNCLSILQSAKLPEMKGIELFRFSKECEFLYEQMTSNETRLKEEKQKEENKQIENQVEQEEIKEEKIKRTRKV